MKITARWYNGEPWRVLPNIEVIRVKSFGMNFYCLAWMKFVIEVIFD